MGLFEQQVADVLRRGADTYSTLTIETHRVTPGAEGAPSCSTGDSSQMSGSRATSAAVMKDSRKAHLTQGLKRASKAAEEAPESPTSIVPADLLKLAFDQPPATNKRTQLLPVPDAKQRKTWKNAKPSKYCHACGGVPRAMKMVCKNIEAGSCRKVFCKPCMVRIYGSWDEELLQKEWTCTHCQGACPVKASCHYYARINSLRLSKPRKAS